MTSSTQQYTNATIYVDGSLLSEAASVQVTRNNNDQPVTTIARGFAGVSKGAAVTEITVESAVPSADFELNPDKYMETSKEVEVTVFAAGRTLTSKGFIMSDSFQYGVNQSSSLSFQFMGGPAKWT